MTHISNEHNKDTQKFWNKLDKKSFRIIQLGKIKMYSQTYITIHAHVSCRRNTALNGATSVQRIAPIVPPHPRIED